MNRNGQNAGKWEKQGYKNERSIKMRDVTEQQILALAPNAAAASNVRCCRIFAASFYRVIPSYILKLTLATLSGSLHTPQFHHFSEHKG